MNEASAPDVELERPLMVVVVLGGRRGIAGLTRLVTLRLRMRMAGARLNRQHVPVMPVAVYPDQGSPSIVYQLTGAARTYVELKVLPAPSRVPRVVARLLGLIAGCSPSAGAAGFADPESMFAKVSSIVMATTGTPAIASRLSVAEVHTTQRVYLVFGSTTDRPEWVVQFGAWEELTKVDAALRGLHPSLPDLVAESVAFTPWRGETWVHIQRGLPGLPWFRLSSAVGGVREWLALRARASEALSRFQAAVGAVSAWTGQLSLGRELQDQLEWYQSTGVPDPEVISRAEKAVRTLSGLGLVRSQWQHGDFCFNNMLVSPDRLGLIDFEEFGQTSVPLHDEFSLAFSTHDFVQSHPGAPPLGALLRDCFDSGRRRWKFDSVSLEALLLHHLFWRLRHCDARPKRREIGAALRRQLSEIVSDVQASRITI